MSAKNIDRFKNAFIAIVLAGALVAVGAHLSRAATPGIISYQGRILVSNAPFGAPAPQTGLFNFALVDNAGTTTFWSNDNTSTAGSQPTSAVSLTVVNGLYSVLLGDTTIPNMTNAVPPTVFSNGTVKLRVWFNDGSNGSKLLAPDQRIVPVGYAMTAAAVDTGAITTGMIAPGVIPTTLPPNGAAGGDLTGTYPNPAIAINAITTTKIADGSVTVAKLTALPKVRAFKTISQSTVSNSVDLAFDSESYDIGNFHDNVTNNTTFTIPVTGNYLVTAGVQIGTVVNTATVLQLTVNGSNVNQPGFRGNVDQNGGQGITLSGVNNYNAGDQIKINFGATNGTSINVNTAFITINQLP